MFFKISLGGEAGTFFVEGAVGFVIGFAEEGLGEEGGVEVLAQVGRRLAHWFYNFVNCISHSDSKKKIITEIRSDFI